MAKLLLRFTPRAQDDFRHLLARTEQQWGQDQAERYQDEIFAVLDLLRENPLLGIARPDIMEGCRSHPAKEHRIYYLADTHELKVVRILHQRQSPHGQFDDLE